MLLVTMEGYYQDAIQSTEVREHHRRASWVRPFREKKMFLWRKNWPWFWAISKTEVRQRRGQK